MQIYINGMKQIYTLHKQTNILGRFVFGSNRFYSGEIRIMSKKISDTPSKRSGHGQSSTNGSMHR